LRELQSAIFPDFEFQPRSDTMQKIRYSYRISSGLAIIRCFLYHYCLSWLWELTTCNPALTHRPKVGFLLFFNSHMIMKFAQRTEYIN